MPMAPMLGSIPVTSPPSTRRATSRSPTVPKTLSTSGGEWISSLDLENVAMSHPSVRECAVVGMDHSKWQERPLVVVVSKPVETAELLAWFDGKVAKWWIPNDVVLVESLPHTATGKISKLELRRQLATYVFPDD